MAGTSCMARSLLFLCLPLILVLPSSADAPKEVWNTPTELKGQVKREMLRDVGKGVVRYSAKGCDAFIKRYGDLAFPILIELFSDRRIEQLNREKIAFYMGRFPNKTEGPHPAIAPLRKEIEFVLSGPLDRDKVSFLSAMFTGLRFTKDQTALDFLGKVAGKNFWEIHGHQPDEYLVKQVRGNALQAIGGTGNRRAYKQLTTLGRSEAKDLPKSLRGAKIDCRSHYGFGYLMAKLAGIVGSRPTP